MLHSSLSKDIVSNFHLNMFSGRFRFRFRFRFISIVARRLKSQRYRLLSHGTSGRRFRTAQPMECKTKINLLVYFIGGGSISWLVRPCRVADWQQRKVRTSALLCSNRALRLYKILIKCKNNVIGKT